MKKATKAFIIVGMVLGFYCIFPIIVGAIALKRLNEAQTADELRGMGVITLIFCSTVAGILMLCLKDKDLVDNEIVAKNTYIDNIKELKLLYDSGALTEEEYNKLKSEELNK